MDHRKIENVLVSEQKVKKIEGDAIFSRSF